MADQILRVRDIEKATGLCERAVREMESNNDFPHRFQITPNGRAVGWLDSEVQAWIAERAASRGSPE